MNEAEDELQQKMRPIHWGGLERALFTLLVVLAVANLAVSFYVALAL